MNVKYFLFEKQQFRNLKNILLYKIEDLKNNFLVQIKERGDNKEQRVRQNSSKKRTWDEDAIVEFGRCPDT